MLQVHRDKIMRTSAIKFIGYLRWLLELKRQIGILEILVISSSELSKPPWVSRYDLEACI